METKKIITILTIVGVTIVGAVIYLSLVFKNKPNSAPQETIAKTGDIKEKSPKFSAYEELKLIIDKKNSSSKIIKEFCSANLFFRGLRGRYYLNFEDTKYTETVINCAKKYGASGYSSLMIGELKINSDIQKKVDALACIWNSEYIKSNFENKKSDYSKFYDECLIMAANNLMQIVNDEEEPISEDEKINSCKEMIETYFSESSPSGSWCFDHKDDFRCLDTTKAPELSSDNLNFINEARKELDLTFNHLYIRECLENSFDYKLNQWLENNYSIESENNSLK